MSYELVAASGDGEGTRTKRPRDGDDEDAVYVIDMKTLAGRVIKGLIVTKETTVAELYGMVQDKEGIPPDQARLIFEGSQLPAWVRDDDENPRVMIETANLPLLRFWSLRVGKRNTAHIVFKLGGPGPTAISQKHELCPPLGIVRDFLRRRLLIKTNTMGVSFSEKLSRAHQVVRELRHAYENYEFMTEDMQKCIITYDPIGETTESNGRVVPTFPYPAHSAEGGGLGRCVGFYDFAHLVTALKVKREWPTNREKLSDDDFKFIRVLALVLYGDNMGDNNGSYD